MPVHTPATTPVLVPADDHQDLWVCSSEEVEPGVTAADWASDSDEGEVEAGVIVAEWESASEDPDQPDDRAVGDSGDGVAVAREWGSEGGDSEVEAGEESAADDSHEPEDRSSDHSGAVAAVAAGWVSGSGDSEVEASDESAGDDTDEPNDRLSSETSGRSSVAGPFSGGSQYSQSLFVAVAHERITIDTSHPISFDFPEQFPSSSPVHDASPVATSGGYRAEDFAHLQDHMFEDSSNDGT
jgi:hypothetical protein